jgi:hypothetical protein
MVTLINQSLIEVIIVIALYERRNPSIRKPRPISRNQ